jgi:hypothetical protein
VINWLPKNEGLKSILFVFIDGVLVDIKRCFL